MKILGALFVIFLFTNVLKAQADTIEMHLIGQHCMKVCKGSTYTDSGIAFKDTFNSTDLTITSEGNFNVEGTTKNGTYKLRYKAIDKNGNTGITEWRIIQVVDSADLPGCLQAAFNCDSVDTIPPVIILKGDPAASVCRCIKYVDAGYDISDNFDSSKDITIETEGTWEAGHNETEGIYTLRYKATDRAGNIGYSGYRYIFVRNPCEFPCPDWCCVSIEENSFSSKFNIYPNPAQNELYIESTEHVSSVSILTLSGQLIEKINISQNLNLPYKIDVKHFPAGIYMVQVKTAQGIIHKKAQISR